MIQQIINKGEYIFQGTIQDFKNCISSFKILEVIHDAEVCGCRVYDCLGKFRYHGETHSIYIQQHMGGQDILYITYRGVINV